LYDLKDETVYGALILISIIKLKVNKGYILTAKDEESDEDKYGMPKTVQYILMLLSYIIVMLILWGAAYFVHYIKHF